MLHVSGNSIAGTGQGPGSILDIRLSLFSPISLKTNDRSAVDGNEERRDSERRLAISHHDGRYIVVQADAK